MQKFSEIIISDNNLEYIKENYNKIKNDNSSDQFNKSLLQLYWKKIIKKGELDVIQWYYDEILQNNYFDINSSFKKKLKYATTDAISLFFYQKIVETDEEYVYRIQPADFKRLLSRGFFLTAKYLLTTNFTNSETFDIDYISKTIVKYGNLDLVEYAIHSDFFHIWKVMKNMNENSDNENDSDSQMKSSETLVYYLLEPNIKVFDVSIDRYENIFFKLISVLDDNEYTQMAYDVVRRIDVIISKNLNNIFNFVISQYSNMITSEIWLENYIRSIYSGNEQSIELIKPYVDKSIIVNYTEKIHNVHMDTYCHSPEAMKTFYNEFRQYITSYHYFDIIVCDLPMFNPDNLSKNSIYLLNEYQDLYKDNITIENIIQYYTRYLDWDGNIIQELLELYPEFNLIDENHLLFVAIREINMNRVHTEYPTDVLLQHNILDYLVAKYPEHYKSIYVNNENIESAENIENSENPEGIYYLRVHEQPYIPIDFNKALCDFLEINTLPVDENCQKECLICQEIIDATTQRIISCCKTGTFDSGHIYCENCLTKWLKDDCRTCPICRSKLF
jgi:hypothetical protein